MGHKGFGRLVSILVALAVTIGVVAFLSALSSQVSGQGVWPQEEAVQELSAPAEGRQGVSFTAGMSGFFAIISIPFAAFLAFAKHTRRLGQKMKRKSQSYVPKEDMAMGKLIKS